MIPSLNKPFTASFSVRRLVRRPPITMTIIHLDQVPVEKCILQTFTLCYSRAS
jgi:hypothetical protein